LLRSTFDNHPCGAFAETAVGKQATQKNKLSVASSFERTYICKRFARRGTSRLWWVQVRRKK